MYDEVLSSFETTGVSGKVSLMPFLFISVIEEITERAFDSPQNACVKVT